MCTKKRLLVIIYNFATKVLKKIKVCKVKTAANKDFALAETFLH